MKLIPCLLVAGLLLSQPAISQTSNVDLEKAKQAIAKVIVQFSVDFHNGDSIAIANHYADKAIFGSARGRDNILAAWGSYIRNSREKGIVNVIYHSNAFATDGEYVTELGDYQMTDANNKAGHKGKYCVVWKQENGEWKLYRDFGL